MSAWIEIAIATQKRKVLYVALFVSAWIEIAKDAAGDIKEVSRTLCECVD